MNSDLIFKSISPGLEYCCESGENDTVFIGRYIIKIGQDVALCLVLRPGLPIFSLIFGSFCSDTIGNGLSRKQDITRYASFFATLKSRHDCIYGKKIRVEVSFNFSLCMKHSPLLEIPRENIRHCIVIS